MSDFENDPASPAGEIDNNAQAEITGGTMPPPRRAGSTQPTRRIDYQAGLPKPGLAPRRPVLPALPRLPVSRALPPPARQPKAVDALVLDLLEQHGPLFKDQVILRLAPVGGEVSTNAVLRAIDSLWNQGRIADCVGGMMAIPAAKLVGAPVQKPGAPADMT
jgi:hypothetical protein